MILAIKQHVGGHFGIARSFWAHPFRVLSLEALSDFSFAERETSLTHGGTKGAEKGVLKAEMQFSK